MPSYISSVLTILHRHSARTSPASNLSQELVGPHPSLFEESSIQQGDMSDLPSKSQCAIHLELLEAFYTLRIRVTTSSRLKKTLDRKHNHKRYSILPGRIEPSERWHRFLSIAVTRFQQWVRAVNHHLEAKHLERNSSLLLPPLDILMVWHAFLLNPHDFTQFCSTNHLDHIRGLSFPWKAIHEALSHDNWNYTLPSNTSAWLRSELSIAPDLVTALSDNEATTLEAITPLTPSEHISLVDNILRQAIFMDKMHDFLWIRSPALQGTLTRALARYERFVALFRLHPGTTLVPTLDVDLVWHTHMCSAAVYEQSMLERTGRYINHDDKLGEEILTGGFDATGRLYEAATGEPYGGCFCWDCEAMRSAGEMVEGDVEAGARKKIEEEVDSCWRAEMARRK
ncbi:hypothetical protein BO86DRAFT_347466 [Aspergillus japonicus CBS 114.51]|uniref:Uncharacterized protein n=1 Tax=Aspergillus japonicus CBS 114.51 TaxID=1448312 RepID=A0A8T8WPX2_ASPJA|nr:hypothetical protein BO86DRAFT_347466 [Aspergillus japonicus CBS 114.51]RAH77429.1 hypothetical protein BO86DRAFT_347466 [Aspergillus japonicus CBS 114.51]